MLTFEQATKDAAKLAAAAAKRAMRHYRERRSVDEDDITGVLVGMLEQAFATSIEDLRFKAKVMRHRRGQAKEEFFSGADILIHVEMTTTIQKYSKGVLVQAKRFRMTYPSQREKNKLREQCGKMLRITPAAFVFSYDENGMRCGAASRMAGYDGWNFHKACGWTAYRFFLELFRSPIGDPRITGANYVDLPIANEIHISAEGELKST